MLSMSSNQRSESLRPSLTEAKGSEAQGRVGDGASESSVEQNCGPMNKNRLRGAKGGRAGQWPRSPLRSKPGSVTSRTIEHLKQRFVEEGLEVALARKPQRKPREAIFDGEFDARLTALACSQAPAGYQRWTVRLLADKLVELKIVDTISTMSVQRSLKKTNCVLT